MAENSSFPPYECTLSPELIEKAKTELNEKPEWRSRDIQGLREMVLKQKGEFYTFVFFKVKCNI